MSYNNVGKVWTVASFEELLNKTKKPDWVKSVTLHHTAAPSLAMRPKGLTAQHIINMRDGYIEKKWRSGPHLFIDEDQIWGMTPLTEKGVHAVSFNSSSIGIEVLGDYDSENPLNGRGLECWNVAFAAIKALLKWIGVPANEKTVLFHRDDPKTSKSCPGDKITKKWVLDNVTSAAPKAIQEQATPTLFPVVKYVSEHKGYSETHAINLLTKKNNLFFFGNDWLEGARYDASAQATVAPLTELQAIAHK